MKNNQKQISIQLEGGIGNQLFQISAGIYFGNKLEAEPIFKTPLEEYGQNQDSWLLNALSLDYKIYSNKLLNFKINKFIWRIDRKMIKKSKIYSFIRRVKDFQNISDSNLIHISTRTREIRGYFQNSIYATYGKESILKILNEFKLSNSAKLLMDKVESQGPVGVHVRRGDYLKFGNLYGLLSNAYYEEVCKKILKHSPNQIFWVFSNDIQNTKDTFSQSSLISQLYFVDLKKELTDLESLILLSKCEGHITGNSTYSWWAAFISDKSKFIFSPDPWNKNIVYSDKLIPKNWIKQKAEWVN